MPAIDPDAEWLEADGIGGFASGTVSGIRTRRYQALLLTATTPPTGRVVLVNSLEAWLEGPAERLPLTSQRYAPGVVTAEAVCSRSTFASEPWPSWTFGLEDGTVVVHDLFVEPDSCETVLRWQRTEGSGPCRLHVRLLLSGRDYHALQRENPDFRFDARVSGGNVSWRPYPDRPAIAALSNGAYIHDPEWYRGFLYTAERERGLDDIEDLASPGVLSFDLAGRGPAVIVLRAGDGLAVRAGAHAAGMAAAERTRRAGRKPLLAHSTASYGVDRGTGKTLVAGFPWFTDWGRDTFIAMRGLVIATGDLATAEDILTAWAEAVSEGMLPNRFPDSGEAPEFNAVDASLWYIIAVHEFFEACTAAERTISAAAVDRLCRASESILQGYSAGTRYRIAADADCLLRAGVPGMQLTWMDAKIGDHVVTPRIGKPVEVQALWVNALRIAGARWSSRWGTLADRAQAAFMERFTNQAGGLFDVVDTDHVAGATDTRLRPNQILAVGGLPFPLLTGNNARAVVDLVETKLLTPLGLRTLSPGDPDYIGHYRGGPSARDGAYHQGTAWPWLMGPFVDAWLAVRGRTESAKAEARARFLAPLMDHLGEAGLGHVSEVADGDKPHRPGGCPFQAWSLGELIRIRHMLDLDD